MNARHSIFFCIFAVPLAAAAQNAPRYLVTDLGSSRSGLSAASKLEVVRPMVKADPATASMLGFEVTADLGGVSPGGINSRGEVTGSDFAGGFIYSHGMFDHFSAQTTATDIDARGRVTGCLVKEDITTGDIVAQDPFLYFRGTLTDLGTLGGAIACGKGINSRGQVAGYSTLTGAIDDVENDHAFLYRHGVLHDLGTLTGPDPLGNNDSAATAINNVGQVTGYSSFSGRNTLPTHAFFFSDGLMSDIGTLGGLVSVGQGINDSSQVAGFSSLNALGIDHAFLYSNGVMQDLGTLGGSDPQGSIPSGAVAINSAGRITGYSYLTAGFDGPFHAFLYTNGTMTDLNTLIDSSTPLPSGVYLMEGWAMNDRGAIIASASDGHLYVLTPITAQQTR